MREALEILKTKVMMMQQALLIKTDPAFTLHERLAADTLLIGELPLSKLLLLNDARLPWVMLVPRRADVSEVIDLSAEDLAQLWQEVTLVTQAMKAIASPDKLNLGALGNIVRQLHFHVIGRFQSDIAWPGPIWGHSPAVPYPPHTAQMEIDKWQKQLGASLLH